MGTGHGVRNADSKSSEETDRVCVETEGWNEGQEGTKVKAKGIKWNHGLRLFFEVHILGPQAPEMPTPGPKSSTGPDAAPPPTPLAPGVCCHTSQEGSPDGSTDDIHRFFHTFVPPWTLKLFILKPSKYPREKGRVYILPLPHTSGPPGRGDVASQGRLGNVRTQF